MYPFLFESVTEIFISSLVFPPQLTDENGYRKHNFSKTHFRVKSFENARFFTCGRTKTEVIGIRWCHTSGADLCRRHIASRMLRKGCYRIFIIVAFLFGTSVFVTQTSFRRKTGGGVAECRGFPLSSFIYTHQLICYSVKATGKLILTENYNLYFTTACIFVTCICLTSVESSMLHEDKGEEKLLTNITIV